jgi:hypothetical protein
MKKLLIIFLVLFTTSIYAQIDYEYDIIVIDSFICDGARQDGMFGLRSVEHNGNIHLSYFMQKGNPPTTKLIYAIRSESGLSTETVFEIAADPWYIVNSWSTLQFDELGEPHIYVTWTDGQNMINHYHKTNNEWQMEEITNFGYMPYIVSDADGSNELGFAYWKPVTGTSGQIVYAYHNGNNWEFDELSSGESFQRTEPSIVHHNNRTYVAYGEGHYPDTLITRIYVRENDIWTLDYEDVNLTPYGGGGIGGLYTKLGASDMGVYMLYDLRRNDNNPTYIKNEGLGWESQSIDYESSLTSFPYSPNIHFDSENTAYWTSENNGFSPKFSWIETDGKAGLVGLPHFYHNYWLKDMLILDDIVYIYYWEGSAGYPYNTPVTFKEIKISLDAIPSGISPFSALNVLLEQNAPNPFNSNTTIRFSIPSSANVKLTVYNILGEEITTLVSEKLAPGSYEKQLNLNDQDDGVYFYVLSVDGYSISRKMLLDK